MKNNNIEIRFDYRVNWRHSTFNIWICIRNTDVAVE
jgi:hypothetical protein